MKKTTTLELDRDYYFDYRFTEEEIAQKSASLATQVEHRNNLINEMKSIAKDYKGKIDLVTSEINILSNNITTGKERVKRPCKCVMDFNKGVKEFYYEGEKVGSEKMDSLDFQLQITVKEEE